MGVLAEFEIVDYNGQNHSFYRFGDGHPYERHGVFANFPLGDHDFALETYVRRLRLEATSRRYFTDVFYYMDLRSRSIKVSSKCFEDCDFKGTFEEAIRHFSQEDYVEKEALSRFPKRSDIEHILVPGFLDGLWVIVGEMCKNLPFLEYDHMSPRILYIGDNVNFYMYDDFVLYPSYSEGRNSKVVEDAYVNARRLGVRLYFNNTRTGKRFTLLYMISVKAHGYILPFTRRVIRYGEELDELTKQHELRIVVEYLKSDDTENSKALNVLCDIGYGEKLDRIREAIMGAGGE